MADWKTAMNRASDSDSRTSGIRRRRSFLGTALLVVVSLMAVLTTQTAEPAAATADDEAQFVAALNQVRAGVGLPALTVNSELVALSRQHAQVMADADQIFHADPISAGFTGPWAKLGENVGVGANVSVLVDAFVASPGHYANIIDPGFTQIGVGVVWKANALYTTHRFLQLPGSPPPTTAAPTTAAPTTAPPTTSPPTTSPPTTVPPTTVPPPTSTAAPTTTQAPPTTTTSLAPLPPPVILPERIIELVNLADLVGP